MVPEAEERETDEEAPSTIPLRCEAVRREELRDTEPVEGVETPELRDVVLLATPLVRLARAVEELEDARVLRERAELVAEAREVALRVPIPIPVCPAVVTAERVPKVRPLMPNAPPPPCIGRGPGP